MVQEIPTANHKNEITSLLIKKGLLADTRLKEIEEICQKNQIDIIEYLFRNNVVNEEELTKVTGQVLGVPYIDLFGRIIARDVINIISEELSRNYQMVAFAREGDKVSVATVDPTNFKALEALDFIARDNSFQTEIYIISPSGLKSILRQYSTLSVEVEEALKTAEEIPRVRAEEVELAGREVEEVIKTAPVSKMVNVILRHAVEGSASDIHIEPVGNETRVRYRVDGVLHTTLRLPKHLQSSLVARIKVLSNLKIDETRVPQDGRYRMTVEGRDVDFRVSTLPLINFEKVVMRILDTSADILVLEKLGFVEKDVKVMKDAIKRPHGMYLMTGPTGSGKSTTLYALLNILNKEGVNIVTLEDPVEYYISGVNQSQINPEVGLSFAAGLRSILRQDPDIIMVGEIRDNETAELAIHAALTGHLVLSTLHTNDSFGAIPRLIDMKIEPFLLSASLNMVVAQRLVRRICPHCKEEISLPKGIEQEVADELIKIPKDHLPPNIKMSRPIKTYRGKGCVRCGNVGYKGRIVIDEILPVNERVIKIVLGGGDVINNLKENFVKEGRLSMKQDGIVKALLGVTTIEEVWTATKE